MIGGTQENDPVFDDKINTAFRNKQQKIEIRREKEINEIKRKERKDKLRKKEPDDSDDESKEKKKPKGRRKSIAVIEDTKELKKAANKISFVEEERKLHEAYQLILSEHVRRIEKMKSRTSERRSSVIAPVEQMSKLKIP